MSLKDKIHKAIGGISDEKALYLEAQIRNAFEDNELEISAEISQDGNARLTVKSPRMIKVFEV